MGSTAPRVTVEGPHARAGDRRLTTQPDPVASRSEASRPSASHRIALASVLVVSAGLGVLAWGALLDRDSVTTNNAYVQGDVVVVTSQVTGTVVSVGADETYRVEKGQVLVTLDDTDARNLLRQKAMQLARVVRETRAIYLNVDTLRSTVAVREANVERSRAEVARTTEGLNRRESLHLRGVVTREDIENARATNRVALSELAAAQASVAAAREALGAHLALIDGVSMERHPAIEAAAAEMREAWLAVKRTRVRAPLSGYVARRIVQIGQRVTAGANLISIVALDRLWVEGNVKETQLRDIRIGQAARLTADVYGRAVTYSGRVVGLGAGTGASFSLLPPQNASGNWIKIVQRVPVRLVIEQEKLDEYPLRMGLSMHVVIDTSDRSGSRLGGRAAEEVRTETGIFDTLEQGADEAVQRVIAENLRPENARRAAGQSAGRPLGAR